MSKVRLSFGILALALLTLNVSPALASTHAHPAAEQGTAIKDGWLVMKLHSLFVPEDVLSGSDIDVDVTAGMVTLQGTVPNEAARARAVAITKGAEGVKGVTDRMVLAPAGTDMGDTAARTADRAAATADRAADKTVSASRKAGRAIDDGWIKSKIYAQYLADWNTVLDDSDIDIDVDKGVVSLSGTVKTAEGKAKAVSIAKATDGVKSVKDLLRVAATY